MVDGRSVGQSLVSFCSSGFFSFESGDASSSERIALEMLELRIGTYECGLQGNPLDLSYTIGGSFTPQASFGSHPSGGSCQLMVSQVAPRISATFSGTLPDVRSTAPDPNVPVHIEAGTFDTEVPTGGCVIAN